MYRITFYSGDYTARQRLANADKCDLYLEQHFNAGSATATYALAVVGTNASRTSKSIAAAYAERVAKEFGTSVANNDFASGGVSVGGYMRRGNGNLIHTAMPAVLLEPLFASNPQHADLIRSESGQERLAKCIADTVRQFFPEGGHIGFSVGHKYQPSKPKDRGVGLAGGGTEADYAEKVLLKAKDLLVTGGGCSI